MIFWLVELKLCPMSTQESLPSFMQKREALVWLLVVLASLFSGIWLLGQVYGQTPQTAPPYIAVLLLLVSALALRFGRREAVPVAVGVHDDSRSASIFALGFAALPDVGFTWRLFALLGAVGMSLFTLWRLPQLMATDSYTAVTLTWLAAFLLFALAVLHPREHVIDWGTKLHTHRWTLLTLLLITVAALILRVWQIGIIPFTLGGDEASQGLEALRVLNGDLRNPFTTGWLGVPTMSFFFNSVSINLMGSTITALRLPWALIGTATVVAAFFLVQQLHGTKLALVTAVLLATYHYHIHYSRLGSNQVADPFFLTCALVCMVYGLQKQSRLGWLLAGAIAGLAFYFYAGARLTPIVMTAVLGYLFILSPRDFWQKHRVGIFIMVGIFLIVAAPMMQYALHFPGEFNARLNQVGIIQSGWLVNEVDARGTSMLSILWDQFQRAALAFNYYPDRTVWYGLPEPLLDPIFGSFFLLGLLYGTIQLFDRQAGPRVAPFVAWWWGGMLLGGMMTESPPSSQRLITLAVPVCFFIAYAIWEILLLARQTFRRLPVTVLLAVFLFMFAFTSLTTYFVEFTPQRRYGGQNAEMATQIAPILNAQKADRRFYFVGAPWMYWGFATLPYLVPDADAQDLEEPLQHPLDPALLPADKDTTFLVIPPRQAELTILQQAYPQGETTEIVSPIDGRLMVTLFDVPAVFE